MIVPMLEILEHAKKGGYGVLAPNVFNEDSVRACLETAVEMDSPIIIDVLESNTKDLVTFGKIIRILAEEVRVPVAINLDHGQNDAACMKAINGGFTGIMCDRSFLAFEENAHEVRKFKELCAPLGITVEAEFGEIAEGEEYITKREEYLTDPDKAAEFVELSGCDCLAVSIGEAHGEYVTEPDIDFERLEKIKTAVDVPLVFHGGSFSGFDNIKRVCEIGCQKVNMGTDAYNYGLQLLMEDPRYSAGENIGARIGGDVMWAGYKERTIDYVRACGSAGKNWLKIVD